MTTVKGLKTKVIAEIQEANAASTLLDGDHLAGDALDLTNMFPSLLKGKTVAASQALHSGTSNSWLRNMNIGKVPEGRSRDRSPSE